MASLKYWSDQLRSKPFAKQTICEAMELCKSCLTSLQSHRGHGYLRKTKRGSDLLKTKICETKAFARQNNPESMEEHNTQWPPCLIFSSPCLLLIPLSCFLLALSPASTAPIQLSSGCSAMLHIPRETLSEVNPAHEGWPQQSQESRESDVMAAEMHLPNRGLLTPKSASAIDAPKSQVLQSTN